LLIAVLNDTHCGARNSSEIFIEYQKKFYEEVFFPYCEENNINHVIHLGDYYDHRKNINFKALNQNRRMFLEPLRDKGMTMDIIPGNHDVFHKNTNELCSLKELLGYYTSNVNIFMKPTTVEYDGTPINFLPWINQENYTDYMKFVKSTSGILMGHLELMGCDMMRGMKNETGMDPSVFRHFDTVYSGHFHTKSINGNVHYLGSQVEFTWSDSGDPKYFHVFNTETREMIPVRNPNTIFEKILYDDKDEEFDAGDLSKYEHKFVKVIVENKTNPYLFDKLIDRLSDIETFELKIVENFQEFLGENVVTSIEDVENTQDLMSNYIESVNTELDKSKLKTLMNSLYNEALDMEIQ